MPSTSNNADIAKLVSQDYSFTQVLGLALYGDKSPADLRNGHNFNMRQIEEGYAEIKITGDTALAILKSFGLTTEDAAKALRTSVDKSADNAQASLERLEAMQIMSKDDAVAVAKEIKQSADSLVALGADTPANAAALKQNIDNLKQNIDDLKQDINTKAPSDSVYSKNQSDIRYVQKKDILVWIGDSWTSNGTIPSLVASGLGMEVKNYAVGGAGFVTGKNFLSQIRDAAADKSYDHERVGIVVLFGGINDAHSGADANPQVDPTLHEMAAAFPAAKKYCIGPQWNWDTSTVGECGNLSKAIIQNSAPSVVPIADACYWALGCPQYYQNNEPGHLTDIGETLFAGKITSVLLAGRPQPNRVFIAAKPYGSTTQLNLTATLFNNFVTISGFVTPTEDGDVDVCLWPAEFKGIQSHGIPFSVYSAPDVGKVVGAFAEFSPATDQPDITASPAGWMGKPAKMRLHGAQKYVQYYTWWTGMLDA